MLQSLLDKVLNKQNITKDEALYLIKEAPYNDLIEASHTITQKCASLNFDMCSIINSKSGNCKADCKWCAQSSHSQCEIQTYPLVSAQKCLDDALYNEKKGVHRFSLVNSGKAPNDKEIEDVAAIFNYIKLNSNILLCASLGLAKKEQLQKLYNSGVRRYHCNLETSKEFFANLCTTHTQEDKIKTLKAAREVGMDLCSGGIIGMGESLEDRVSLALTLQELEVRSVPINILHPIKGTPLQDLPILQEEEILRTIAMFRFVLPQAFLRLAGGRILITRQTFKKALYTGINSAIVGDLLTTIGSKIDEDKEDIQEMGYNLN